MKPTAHGERASRRSYLLFRTVTCFSVTQREPW